MYRLWTAWVDTTPIDVRKFQDTTADPMLNPRAREIELYESYFEKSQYNSITYNWDGEALASRDFRTPPSNAALVPAPGLIQGFYVPMRMRRPSVTRDVAAQVVKGFTSLLFGEGKFPQFTVPENDAATEFLKKFSDQVRLQAVSIEARNKGGSAGSVVVVLSLGQYGFRLDTFSPRYCRPLFMERRTSTLAAVEIRYRYEDWYDSGNGLEWSKLWYRRVITTEVDVTYKPTPVEEKVSTTQATQGVQSTGPKTQFKDSGAGRAAAPNVGTVQRDIPEDKIEWEEQSRVEHNLGYCPALWIRNMPGSDSVYGLSDYEGQLDKIDSVNRMESAIDKSLFANLDPTLILGMRPDDLKGGIQKGSHTAICVGESGHATYLEIKGDGIKLAMENAEKRTHEIYKSCEWVDIDPEKVTAGMHSSPALRFVFTRSLNKASALRTQYGDGMLLRIAYMALDMRRRATDLIDALKKSDAEAKGAASMIEELGDPGQDDIHPVLDWGDWFSPSPDDIKSAAETGRTLNPTATLLSGETIRRNVLGRSIKFDEGEEKKRIQDESREGGMQAMSDLRAVEDHAGDERGDKEDDEHDTESD